jgi:predicted GNAT family N-acyltransferase
VVEVGQPWRNERAKLTPELLSVGRVITAHGHRSANAGERLMKAERVVIDGKSYNLYPDRPS